MILQRIWRYTSHTGTLLKKRRNFNTMDVSGMELAEVVKRFEEFAPCSFAENWDNVGLLVEPSTTSHVIRKILLTNDLTETVMDEAVEKDVDMIFSYHPPIFSPLKRLTKSSWKERILLKAIENKIAIYSPHTALDVVKGGVNDWLADGLGKVTFCKPLKCTLVDSPSTGAKVPLEDTGIGRLCFLEEAVSIGEMIKRIKKHLKLDRVRLARAFSHDRLIKTVAICAGSGGSVLKGVQADMYLTGEMSHHDLLDAISKGIHVVLGEHSNTERGFLEDKLSENLCELFLSKVTILNSCKDKDPLSIL